MHGRLVRMTEEIFTLLKTETLKARLVVKANKNKRVMMNVSQDLNADGHVSEEIGIFKHLGALITGKNKIRKKIKTRISASFQYYRGLQTIFKSLTVRTVKIKIPRPMLKLIAMYGCKMIHD
jgi:hypothetical protein